MQLGTLVGLWCYPVKSMAGQPVLDAQVGWQGLAGDRRYAFVAPGNERSGFPWLTQRRRSEMQLFTPRFAEPDRPEESITLVRAPDGAEYDVTDPALAARLGDGVRVIKQGRGTFDSAPLSLITTATVARAARLAGRPLEPERFRPNLLVETETETETETNTETDADGADPFPEDGWVGATLRIGELEMRVDRRDPRCVMISIDPATGERDPRVLRELVRGHGGDAGVYGSVQTPGRVAVGDAVTLETPGTPTE